MASGAFLDDIYLSVVAFECGDIRDQFRSLLPVYGSQYKQRACVQYPEAWYPGPS